MRFNEQWLREWVNPEISTDVLAHQLTMAGLEVDAVEPVAGTFSQVVVGEVLAVVAHPDADKLRVCQVEVGQGEPLGIVCGAANVRVGLRVAAALIGAELPGGIKIKAAKLRGVPSAGMLCSAKELGLAEASQGLLELPADAPVGQSLRDYLLLDDVAIELGLTPNRGDCLSVAGIAREVAAITGAPLTPPAIAAVAATCSDTFPVTVAASAACPRYVGRVVRNLNPAAPTPLWMQERLRRAGLRSLGALVDVTNYLLLELGQPMHAFDLQRLQGGIEVRLAQAGEQLALLNETTITLEPGSLVIADASGPVALAGIMGGASTAVGDGTRDIFLESAFFSPEQLAGRARRYGLHTDSSHRFERGVSPALQREALERATALLVAIAGGEVGPVVEVVSAADLPQRGAIRLRHPRLCQVLGAEVPAETAGVLLARLGLAVQAVEGGWSVEAPPWRFDLATEEDLIEEVARLYGYDQLPAAYLSVPLELAPRSEGKISLRLLRQILVDHGFQEAITYSFVDPKYQRLLDPQRVPVPVANPISTELSVMRTTLLTGLVQTLIYNANRQQSQVRIFESGLRFLGTEGAVEQEPMLAALAWGPLLPEQWGERERKSDLFDLKGDLESLIAAGGSQAEWQFVAAPHPALHPGQCASILRNGQAVGWIGALHPQLMRELDLPGQVLVFEVTLAALTAARVPGFQELSKFPANRRDIAIVVDQQLSVAELIACARRAAPAQLRDLKLFDVYQGKGLDSGKKSVALGLTLQDDSRTLTDAEVDAAVAQVVTALRTELGGTLRE